MPPTVPASLDAPQTGFANRLAAWVGFVRDAEEDPRNQAVQGCHRRLDRVGRRAGRARGSAAAGRRRVQRLANGARHHNTALLSVNAALLGRAQRERAEGDHDLALLVAALGLRRAPGGQVDARSVADRLAARRAFRQRALLREPRRLARRRGLGRADRAGRDPAARLRRLFPEPHRPLAGGLPHARVDRERVIRPCDGGDRGADARERAPCRRRRDSERGAHRLLRRAAPRADGAAARPSRAAKRARMGAYYLRFHQPGLPAEYRSRECRNGGRFDLRPADPRFP